MSKSIRWSDFRYEPVADLYGVEICGSEVGCAQGYSRSRHLRGYAENHVIHWLGWHTDKPRKRGLHRLLYLISGTKVWPMPRWRRLWARERWASQEAEARFKVRFPASYSRASRDEAFKWAKDHGVPARTLSPAIYQWMVYGKENE